MADDDDNVVEADSARVTRHGSLWRSRPQAKKKKLFYVLTDAVLFAFKSERAYRSQAAPAEILPLYDVAAVPRLEHAPVPHKSPKHFHLLTSFGVLRLKSSSINAAAAWRTSASDAIPPTWNEILSFGAVTPDDVLHVAVYCTASKTMSFFDDTSLQGAFNLDVSRLDLDRDLFGQGRACGLHRWLSLADRYGRESGSQLHLQVYAVPADTVADATMQTPAFLRDRLDLVAAQRPLDDDAIFTQGISVFTGTWNVGEAAPPDDVRRWLHRASLCDLVAIASQECVYDPRPPFTTCVDDWVGSLHQALGGPDDYVLVKHEGLWGIRIVVFASSRIASLITTPKRRTVATGVGHVLGNKGGACVALQLRHSSFCFVSMHLAAHQHRSARRNADLSDILRGIQFASTMTDAVHQFDHLVLMGDLNYRVDFGSQGSAKTPSPEQFNLMIELIRHRQWPRLFAKDQLRHEMQANGVLCEFVEGAYDFEPSFKVLPGCVLDYNPVRSPAWCDRILWKSRVPSRQLEFSICKDVCTSDHKPIYSVFEMDTFYYQPCCDPRYARLDLSFAVVLVTDALDNPVPAPTVKLRSPVLPHGKATLDPQRPRDLFPIRYTNLARLVQMPIGDDVYCVT
ncbi:hypothetical protein PBRA_008255 [Plasmodiophora brassicae]|uniref:PH domain-containing protein n=1 Tax=Plasmodiophora brassicae TaxID=37360 RepID=A0A0G4IZY7_PLABS|nr:hypothetical protein PBRA_008255 [Plasmodiophora brassicae]